MIQFTVWGQPRPQGSTRAFIPKGWNRPIITSDNPALKPWRQQVSGTALEAASRVALTTPVYAKGTAISITLRFYFERPISVSKKRRNMTVKPDIDKLVRACLDSLKGIIYTDDSNVVKLSAEKHYGLPQRVEVIVDDMPADRIVSQPALLQEVAG